MSATLGKGWTDTLRRPLYGLVPSDDNHTLILLRQTKLSVPTMTPGVRHDMFPNSGLRSATSAVRIQTMLRAGLA